MPFKEVKGWPNSDSALLYAGSNLVVTPSRGALDRMPPSILPYLKIYSILPTAVQTSDAVEWHYACDQSCLED